ncbi:MULTISPECIES: ROK family protein [Blautia]|uniref:ROK family protein n=1 Tax=Blautia hominis TaxID=2025493 RepID=A0ABQ0B935_9FIRM|nr:ROK family protein [Blautia marasmi]
MAERIFDINNDNKDILNIIRCKPGIEKTVLAKEANIAFKTLANKLDFLFENNLVDLEPKLKINRSGFYSFGISIGGSHCKIAIIDAEYRVLPKEEFNEICDRYNVFNNDFFSNRENNSNYGYKYFETPDNRTTLEIYLNEILKDIIKLYDIAINQNSLPPIISIGVALTGSIDSSRQVIVRSHNIGYLKNISKEMLLKPENLNGLKERRIEFVIDHNAKAMATCEKFSLYHEDNLNYEYNKKKNVVCFYLGSGIGCGIILNNRLIRGCRNFSGELGHIQVPRYPELLEDSLPQEPCTCGAKGCIEHLIIHDVFDMDRESFQKATSDELSKRIEEWKNADGAAYERKMKILGYYIGWAVDAITKLLNPGLIIFSGKMTCFITKAWSYIKPTVGEMDYAMLDCQMILSKYAALAPSIGAAILSTFPADELIEWII